MESALIISPPILFARPIESFVFPAAVGPEEMDGVPHYLVDEFDPSEEFNVVVFVERAKAAMEKIYAAGHIPIIVGGTGFSFRCCFMILTFHSMKERRVTERN